MKQNLIPRILLLSVLAIAPGAHADFVDLLVNDDNLATTHERPRVAVAPSGSFAIVWADQRSGQSDIYFQRISLAGTRINSNQLMNLDTLSGWQAYPALGAAASGQYTAVWQDFRNSSYPYDPDVYHQRTDSSGSPIGENISLTVELPDSLKEAPDLAIASDGTGMVVWADYRNRNWDIFGQFLAADGSRIGNNFKINDDVTSAQQHGARVSVAPGGWYAVVWYDNRQGSDDIFVQMYSANGVKRGSNLRANSDISSARQAFPDIAADGRGRFHVVWTDWRNGSYPTNPDVYYRKFDTLFQALTIDTRLNTDGSTRPQRDPAVAADRMGNVGMVWADSTASSWDVMGQILDADGAVRVASTRMHTPSDSAQLQPDIALDGRYRYVTWSDKRLGRFDIYTAVAKYNDPHVAATPASLSFSMNPGGPLPSAQTVVVEHAGLNSLHFSAVSSQSWLQVSPASGTTPDTLSFSVTSLLPEGIHSAEVRIVDTDNGDSSLVVTVTVNSAVSVSADSVICGAVSCLPVDSTDLPIEIYLESAARGMVIPLTWDSSYFAIGSVTLTPTLASRATAQLASNEAGSTCVVVTANPGDSLPSGKYEAMNLRILTTASEGFSPLDSITLDSFSLHIAAMDGSWSRPLFIPGEVTVSSTTDVGDPEPPHSLPQFGLEQNYPNPFNGSTVIRYSLVERSSVRLEIFNVLGQSIRVLSVGELSAGEHSLVWDGRTLNGRDAPSGIYFYRLLAGESSQVRKMILLK
ncbi:MAG: T9SS type A sorting domain-containing protein [bacterium]|nr:T9SS type A sorting domain-containing protein [bacterium]